MTAQSSSVESIFSAALEITSVAERAAYLDRACAGNTALRTRVETLLKADADAGSFLGKPPAGLDATVDGTADGRDGKDGGAWASVLSFLAPCDKPGRLGVLRGKAGEYEVVELVGRGGMGAVLRALDTKLNRVVAVKVMAPGLAVNPTAVKRFLREAQAAAAIHHDHVVTIYAVDDEHQPPFLVMEFVEGETLAQKIERQGALRLVQILRIGSQIAAGLAAAHKHGLIHRDVKPGNILLENGVERVKITDFGLARAADDLEMTQSGLIAGTPQYMSPEQAKGEVIDARSDLFSLGSVLYAMCTGRPAFRAETAMGVLRRVCYDTPRPIIQTNPEIPKWLEGIVGKLLAKDPAERFQTAKEVADLLGQRLAHVQNPGQAPSPTTVKLPPAKRSRLRSYVFFAAAGVLLLLGASAFVNREFLYLYFNNFGVITVDKSAHVSRVLVKDEIENRSFLLGQGQTTEIRAHSYIVRVQTEGDVHTFDWQFRDPSSAGSSPLKVNTNYRIHVRPGETVHLRFSRTSVLPQPRPPAVSSGGAGAQAKTFPPGSSADILTSDEWEWTEPENLGPVVNSEHDDSDPFLSADGKTLYFWSTRAGRVQGSAVWTCNRPSDDGPWSTPSRVAGVGIEGGPALSGDGLTIYFHRTINGVKDLFFSTRQTLGDSWSPAMRLPISSPQNDWFPALSNDECTLLFASDRPGGEGGLDLWMCQRSNATAAWSNPKNLGPTINTPQNDQMPRLAADGLTLLCVRVGAGQDIVMHTRATPKGPWSKAIHLDSKINSTAPDWTPFLSADFRTLLLSSQRPGGHGFRDLWVSRRVKRQTNE